MDSRVFGIISPHPPIFVPSVGGERARVTRDSLAGLESAAAALRHFDPQVVVLMSPHAPSFADAFCVDGSTVLAGSLAQFGDGTTHEFKGDPELAAAIVAHITRSGDAVSFREDDARLRAGWLDHASLVPLLFLIDEAVTPIVILSLSGLDYDAHRRVGQAVAKASGELDRRVAFIASGDLSHRLTHDAPAGFSPRGAELDAEIVDCVRRGTLEDLMHLDPSLVEAGGECGLRSLVALGGFAGEDPVPSRVLAYEGPWGVGYLTALVGAAALKADDEVPRPTPDRGRKGGMPGEVESEIVSLARSTIEAHVRDGVSTSEPLLNDSSLPHTAGVFVSLHRGGELRGCIGTILPTQETLAEEVAHNAIEAAVRDPRFPPLGPGELGDLEIKVDVLRHPEPCEFDDLDPKTYGVIVSSGWRRGLLLPDLPGVEDAETQVLIALQKAGIRSEEPCSLERFKVDRYT